MKKQNTPTFLGFSYWYPVAKADFITELISLHSFSMKFNSNMKILFRKIAQQLYQEGNNMAGRARQIGE